MKISNIETIERTKYLNFYSVTYKDDFGNDKSPYMFVSRFDKDNLNCCKQETNSPISPNAIEAFTYLEEDEQYYIVMIKEFRAPLNSYVYSFPAGLIEENESAKDALVREVEEEIGGRVREFKFLQNYPLAMCAGLCDESNMLALVELYRLEEQHLDEGEQIEVVKFTPLELADKIRNNELKLTASGLLGATILLNKLGINLAYVFNCDF